MILNRNHQDEKGMELEKGRSSYSRPCGAPESRTPRTDLETHTHSFQRFNQSPTRYRKMGATIWYVSQMEREV